MVIQFRLKIKWGNLSFVQTNVLPIVRCSSVLLNTVNLLAQIKLCFETIVFVL
jgi:hypothetical protein